VRLYSLKLSLNLYMLLINWNLQFPIFNLASVLVKNKLTF